MLTSLTIKVSGTADIHRKLRKLGTSLTDLRISMMEIGDDTARYFSNQGFNSQGGVFGAVWKPLTRSTMNQKAKKYPGRSPLVRTGKMRDSFTYVASSRQVLVGNSADYFKYHQSTLPRNKLPRRQMMGVNSQIQKIIKERIEDDVRRKIQVA